MGGCHGTHPLLTEVEDLIAEWQELKDLRYEKEILRKCLRIRSVKEGELVVKRLKEFKSLLQARKMAKLRGQPLEDEDPEEKLILDLLLLTPDEMEARIVEEALFTLGPQNASSPVAVRQIVLEEPGLEVSYGQFEEEVKRRQQILTSRFSEREPSVLPRYATINIHDMPIGRELTARLPTESLIERIHIERLEREIRDWELATERIELKSQAELLRLQTESREEALLRKEKQMGITTSSPRAGGEGGEVGMGEGLHAGGLHASAGGGSPGDLMTMLAGSKKGPRMPGQKVNSWAHLKDNIVRQPFLIWGTEDAEEDGNEPYLSLGSSLTQLLCENHAQYGLHDETSGTKGARKKRTMDYVIRNFIVHDGRNLLELQLLRQELAALYHDLEEILTEMRQRLRMLDSQTIRDRGVKLRLIQKRELRRWKSLALAAKAGYEGPILAPTNNVILHPDNKVEYGVVRMVTVIYKNWDLMLKLKEEDEYYVRKREGRLSAEEEIPQDDDEEEPVDD
eukprot:g6968.t1